MNLISSCDDLAGKCWRKNKNGTWEKTSKGNEEKNANRTKWATGRNHKENGKIIKTSWGRKIGL